MTEDAVTAGTASPAAAALPGDLADLLAEKRRWKHWLMWDLPELRDGSRNWRLWDPALTGTERQCQDRAVAECGAALDAVTAELAALRTKAAPGEAARRPEQGETR